MPLVSLISGIVAADLLDSFPPHWCLPALIATTLAASFLNRLYPFLLSLALLFFVWGQLSLEPFLRPAPGLERFADDRSVVLEGVLDGRVERSPSGSSRIFLQVERVGVGGVEQGTRGRMLVYVKEGKSSLCTGDRIMFASRIREPRNLGLPGETDYVRRLAYQDIHVTGFVLSMQDVVLLRAGEGWRHDLDLLAARLGAFIGQAEPGEEGGVLKALLLGDRGDVPEQLQEAFARSGVNHILSISGFHVGILFFTLFQVLYFLARRSEWLALRLTLKPWLLLGALPAAVFYLFLSGDAPATLRSVLMIAAVVAALQLKRELDPVNTIMLAACAILSVAPQTLFDVSFQLSFLAIWGLSVLTPTLSAPKNRAGKVLRWLALLLFASAAAILATAVHVAYYFQRISLVGLVANLLVVPLMGYGAVISGFLGLALALVWQTPAAWLLHLAAVLVHQSDLVVEQMSRAPVFTGYVPDRLDLLLACLSLCAVTLAASKLWRFALVAPLLTLLLIRGAPVAVAGDGTMRLYFLSVGQGDATLVHLPGGAWLMVDGGGNATDTDARVGPRLLLPALRAMSVRRIDYLVLSHEHPDHLQGVLYLAAYFEVGEFLANPVTLAAAETQQLKWVLAARGVPVRELTPEQPARNLGGALLRPLWPGAAMAPAADANAASLVFRLEYGASSVLFTGDVGEKEEQALLERWALKPCTLLKVAHHGSKYSTCEAFLQAVRPVSAVISAGYRNSFHLPAPSTIHRMQRHGIRIYRTDLEGTVEAVCRNDGSLIISTPWGHFN